MKISILTLGCKVNQTESAMIEGNLRKHGISIVSLYEHPDYCVVNTCTVTAKSDYKSRQLIRRAFKAGAKVLVTGCYSELKPDEVRKMVGVHEIVKNSDKLQIIKMLTNNTKSYSLCYFGRSRPYIKVQDGCNNACTYCIVQKARGRSRSVEVSEVVRQAVEFESEGYNEIVLTGIHLGVYGIDLIPKKNLSNLIRTLLDKTKIPRIRLSSLDVNEIDDEIIELLQEIRLCKHVHIPVQSGDNNILKRMHRKYTTDDYKTVINKIKTKITDISIGTDVIVGFPGEGEKEFKNTKTFLDSLPLTYMHIFPFSSRPNTVASQIPMHVSSSVKKERVNELKVLHTKKKQAYLNSQIHKILDIIIEEQGNETYSVGTSSNYLKVKVYENWYPKKSLIYLRISEREGDMLRGIDIDKM